MSAANAPPSRSSYDAAYLSYARLIAAVSARAAPTTAEDAASASAAHASRLVIGAVAVASREPSSALARRRASVSPPTREGDARARISRLHEIGAPARAVNATVAIAERALGVLNGVDKNESETPRFFTFRNAETA